MAEVASASPADSLSKLRGIVDAFPGQGFAVVDGGHFDDLPTLFKRDRLFARSLFLDNISIDVQSAGPWLISIDQKPDALDIISYIVKDKPAVVYWCCCAGEVALFKHLRTLNLARIPLWAARGGDTPPSIRILPEPHELVMFRHWDPTVLEALLPVLDKAQFSRILGLADEIAFGGGEMRMVRRAIKESGWPKARRGPLLIDSAQIIAMSDRRRAASRNRVAALIRKTGSPSMLHASNEETC